MEQWLDQYLDYLKEVKRVSGNTYQAYATDLKQFIAYLRNENVTEFSKITDTRMQAYMLYQKKQNKSAATVSRSFASIKNFISFLIRKRVMDEDPTECIHPPKVDKTAPKSINYEQMIALLEAPNLGTVAGRRDRAILELLYATGIKASELIQLRISDVNIDFGSIHIIKDGKERVLPLGQTVKNALSEYLKDIFRLNPDQEILFCNRMGNGFTRQGIYKIVKDYAKKAGIEETVSLQIIRNSFAVHMFDNGADLNSMQELLGVSDVIATQRFLQSEKTSTFSVYKRTHPRE